LLHTNKYFAFFDLDKTIISVNSGALLVRLAYKKQIMNTRDLLNAVIQGYLYKFNLKDTNLIISKMGDWLKGMKQETINELCDEVVKSYLINKYRPEIINEIAFHKKNGAGIIILSSAISSICEPVGRRIGADYIICTTMESNMGILSGKPVGNYCFEAEKRVRLLSWCKEYTSDPSEAWYYADSIADLPALEVVGNPVCVYPDKKLAKIAKQKGWRKIPLY
jgi:HAD superfamily hydrolase (TIGR01490 family)